LEVRDLTTGYGTKEVVHRVNLKVDEGEIVLLAGNNGAGKTTTLNAIVGMNRVTGGSVLWMGEDVTNATPLANVRRGMYMVMQGKAIFPDLTVIDNLLVIGNQANGGMRKEILDLILDLFPVLSERKSQMAGSLSGGEQEMLAIGMGLMVNPKLILLDEPTLGLSPLLAQKLLQTIKEIAIKLRKAVLLVEQNLEQGLSIAERMYVMKMGEIFLEQDVAKMDKSLEFWDLF